MLSPHSLTYITYQVFYPHGTKLIWISTDGEICQLNHQAIAAELALGPVLLCHRRWSEARAGVEISNYLDIMELYAFIRPARFALPTPTGLAQQLGLARPQSGEDMASLLPQIAFLLLDELAAQPTKEQTEAAKIADMMAAGAGDGGLLFWRILASPHHQPHHQMDDKRRFGTGLPIIPITPRKPNPAPCQFCPTPPANGFMICWVVRQKCANHKAIMPPLWQ